jgi:signal transduction histidine kinase
MPRERENAEARWLAAALAKPVAPLAATATCGEVYEMMARDANIVALAVVADNYPLGLVDRVSLMSNFARQFWRDLFGRRPITRLMDADPVIVDAGAPIEVVGLEMVAREGSALNSGFIVVRDGRYAGVGNSVDLLKRVADRAREHASELESAHAKIRGFTEELEHRVEVRTAELRAAQEELVRKERLSTLGQLTATVAHELRNPLSSIRNTLFALKETAAPAGLERPLGRIERSVTRCDRIISELLDFTRARALRPANIAVDEWLDEILDEQSLPPGITLLRRFAAPGYVMRLDCERMRQVVVNLVENAAQALAEGAPADRERQIMVGTRALTSGYELTIEDNGPGIPESVLPQVFEPLFSTKSFGTGLGLPTVKQIVEQHGGVIKIDSEPGCGARATVLLPHAVGQIIAA